MDAKMKVERAAAGAAIDGVLKYVNHGDDRTKALLNLTDFVQKFTGNMFAEKTFDNIRTMLQNPDNKWVRQPRTGRAGSAGDQNDCFEPGIPGSFRRNETDPYEP